MACSAAEINEEPNGNSAERKLASGNPLDLLNKTFGQNSEVYHSEVVTSHQVLTLKALFFYCAITLRTGKKKKKALKQGEESRVQT